MRHLKEKTGKSVAAVDSRFASSQLENESSRLVRGFTGKEAVTNGTDLDALE